MNNLYELPFFVIPMPLDKDGRGPETDVSKCVRTVWQVWDYCNQTVIEYETEEEAIKFQDFFNRYYNG